MLSVIRCMTLKQKLLACVSNIMSKTSLVSQRRGNLPLTVTGSLEGADAAFSPEAKRQGSFPAAGGTEQFQSRRADKSSNSDRDDREELDKDQ